MSKPSSDSYFCAVDNLMKLDFIDDELNPLPMGKLAAKVRYMTPENIRMIFAAYEENVFALELITIAAFIETRGWDSYKNYEYKKNVVKHKHEIERIEVFDHTFPEKLSKREENGKASSNDTSEPQIETDQNQIEGGYYNGLDDIFKFGGEKDGFGGGDDVGRLSDAMWGFAEDNYQINKIILGCDFIETLFLYDAFLKNINRTDIEYWCYKNKIDYKGMLDVVSKRDEIIETLASCNFKINYDAPRINTTLSDSNLDYIQRIKSCIKAGYRNHTATWDPDRNAYIDDNKK